MPWGSSAEGGHSGNPWETHGETLVGAYGVLSSVLSLTEVCGIGAIRELTVYAGAEPWARP